MRVWARVHREANLHTTEAVAAPVRAAICQQQGMSAAVLIASTLVLVAVMPLGSREPPFGSLTKTSPRDDIDCSVAY